ncbi:MAG: hypothetical protein IPH44_13065 [Myxococcales bacterium]|nr:hypothetical protein [Myxococcales bacterium]MBP6849078.1 hypothetical protein [Kofleriaceae bacterium]
MSLRSLSVAAALLALPAVLPACVESDLDKGDEAEVPADGKLDSFARPTDHGAIGFDTPAEGVLSTTARYHTWTFALTGAAQIHAFTGPSLTSRYNVDTVLYLYKQRADGTWGPYLARNDDSQGAVWSSLTRDLGAGSYRILVKGYAASTRGQFSASVGCTGAGCAPANTCLFGATFGDLLASTAYAVTGDRELHASDFAGVPADALDAVRVVRAVQQSAHTDVTTVAQAFAAVDQQVIRRVDIYDEAGARAFVALEYGAGDNSYGAVFAYGSAAVVSKIHDGDLEACTPRAQTCALGADWSATRASADFTRISANVVTSAGQLTGADATDALAAIRVAYADATSLADGLTRIDGRTLNVVDLRHAATGTTVRAFEYGAGDNSYGAIFKAGTTERLASIVDLTYYDCAFAR